MTQIELRPLTARATAELAAALLPPRRRDLAARVAEASGGNPFFAEEVARAIVEERGDDRHGFRTPFRRRSPPGSICFRRREAGASSTRRCSATNFLEQALTELLGEPAGRRASKRSREGARPGAARDRARPIRFPPPADPRRRLRVAAEGGAGPASRARGGGDRGRAGERHAELAELIAFHRAQAAELEPTPETPAPRAAATSDAAEVRLPPGRDGAARRSSTSRPRSWPRPPTVERSCGPRRTWRYAALSRRRGGAAAAEAANVAEESGERAAAAAYARLAKIAPAWAASRAG